MNKKCRIKPEDLKDLFHTDGPEGCIASDRIMVDGEKIGYLQQEMRMKNICQTLKMPVYIL